MSLSPLFLFSCFHGYSGLNQLVSMNHLLCWFMCDLTLKKGNIKPSSYGLLTDMASQVECLAPGQKCITCIICTKGKSLKEKERVHQSYTHQLHGNFMTWLNWNPKKQGTQKTLSKTNHLMISFFSLSLFSHFRGNFGLLQIVSMRYFLSFCMCDLLLIQKRVKSCSYGLLTELAL